MKKLIIALRIILWFGVWVALFVFLAELYGRKRTDLTNKDLKHIKFSTILVQKEVQERDMLITQKIAHLKTLSLNEKGQKKLSQLLLLQKMADSLQLEIKKLDLKNETDFRKGVELVEVFLLEVQSKKLFRGYSQHYNYLIEEAKGNNIRNVLDFRKRPEEIYGMMEVIPDVFLKYLFERVVTDWEEPIKATAI